MSPLLTPTNKVITAQELDHVETRRCKCVLCARNYTISRLSSDTPWEHVCPFCWCPRIHLRYIPTIPEHPVGGAPCR